jgi:hypothetical protein
LLRCMSPLLAQSGHRPGYKPRINLWPLALEIELIQYRKC